MTNPTLRASLIALSLLAAGPVLAQAVDEDGTTVVEGEGTTTVVEGEAETTIIEAETTEAVETVAVTDDDRGFNWGWLGLLGLLGLTGLGGRRRQETITTVTTHPTTHSTPR